MKYTLSPNEDFEIVWRGQGNLKAPKISSGTEIIATEDYVANLVNYKAITVSFSLSASTPAVSGNKMEKGNSLTSVSFAYNFSKTPETGTTSLTDYSETIGKSGTATIDYSSAPVTTTKTWTIRGKEPQVPGKEQAEATGNVTLSFMNGIYYGVAAQPEEINSAFILNAGFTKTLSATRIASFSANAGAAQYVWYALPSSIGKCAFKDTSTGFDAGLLLIKGDTGDPFEFTNSFGVSEAYYVYRSKNPNLGQMTISVSAA